MKERRNKGTNEPRIERPWEQVSGILSFPELKRDAVKKYSIIKCILSKDFNLKLVILLT